MISIMEIDMHHNKKGPFDLAYDNKQGHFTINLFNKPMLGTKLLARIGKKAAILKSVSNLVGVNSYGSYEQWELTYVSPVDENKSFIGQIMIYEDHAVFKLINGFTIHNKKNKHIFGHPYISFPCFEGDIWDKNLSCLSFKRQAPFNYPEQWYGRAVDSLREGKNIPLIVTSSAFEAFVLSPMNQFLYGTVSISHFPKSIRCGIPRSVNKLPKGHTYETILVYQQGVNKAIDLWGHLLRLRHKVQPIKKDEDVLLKYISYWTNAGSAYWYKSYKNKSYEETLKTLKAHHKKIGITYGSYQLDSWWYKKGGDEYTSGIREWAPKAVSRSKNFNAILPFMQKYKDLDLFEEDKLSYVQSFIDAPIGCHFKQLAKDSVYVMGHEEDFLIEDFPIPKNKKVALSLFYEIFNHPKWRMNYIVHDWLQYMNDNHKGFQNLKVSKAYFEALDITCQNIEATDNKRGSLTLQLCMTQPHMTLNSVTMSSVTSIRSTSDSDSFFVEGSKRWWWHMYSSKFIQALGKYAFYDNRQSYKSHVHPLASYSRFELIWLGLSCGPIGIGDPIGKGNIELIRRVIKENGEIIKPDLPSQPLDQSYLGRPHNFSSKRGVGVYSHSTIKTLEEEEYRVYYLLLFNVHPFAGKVFMDYSLGELGCTSGKNYVIYDYFKEKYDVVDVGYLNHYALKRRKFYYQIIAPIEKGFAYLGDVSKHVTCSNQLVSSIHVSDNKLMATISYENKMCNSEIVVYCEKPPQEVLYDGRPIKISYKNQLVHIRLPQTTDEAAIRQAFEINGFHETHELEIRTMVTLYSNIKDSKV